MGQRVAPWSTGTYSIFANGGTIHGDHFTVTNNGSSSVSIIIGPNTGNSPGSAARLTNFHLSRGLEANWANLYAENFNAGGRVVVSNSSNAILISGTITNAGVANDGVLLVNNNSMTTASGLAVTLTGTGYTAVYVTSGGTLRVTDSQFKAENSAGGSGLYIGANAVLDGAGLAITSEAGHGVNIDHGVATISDSVVTAEHGSGLRMWGDTASAEFIDTQIDADIGVELSGNNKTVILDHSNINASSGTGVLVSADLAQITLNNGSAVTGDLIATGSTLTTVNLNDSNLTGNVTGSDSAALDLTLSGSDSTLLGDITQSGSSAVTVILDDRATGQGGYTGGNLITNSDSAWTFDKNSHGNYGENNGTWNIGNYEVIFDNMIHTGTINISVNTDTGEGGSISVTGTADGEGTIHINTTGDGKADPNQVLPGKVTGDGTEHWQWDPIDWGIDTIIKDGDHFIKKGTSPAGAVLNSSVAIQQAMWFAQQNSLLKRMGELRYGARASRPLAGGTPAFHNLIENIWLRSYGQQLNVGSKVAGQAYEQLIYGVDLGTDHKFTLSTDSDLYLGVYAGYGRSDIDYRAPGADGEINSYYGGLYATWLHASGFYIDATVKAASVDNDLKAPYGNTQLKANYSDVNIGGSIEIGNKFTFADNWFIEPQFQVNYLHILAEDYNAGPLTISAQDLDALQLRIGSVFGRTINLTNSGALQPYIKVSGVETISSGGAIRNGYQSTRANTDGARAELGGGLIWQLDTNNQLHLDYEA
ncbi:MAG: autotransporter outer membrane beta-barrel domain-containing protein, partial [Verrucomicrobiales bacterium]|nr:autotransporter outer membrane beta-barrel domain-containing protein [Verrucomicrobiales bacterium]